MKQHWLALLSGALFGLGLALSGLMNPMKVLAFLDVFGAWDASLLFAMAGAWVVIFPVFYFVRRAKPILAESFSAPAHSQIDRDLLLGAALFGIGWGIAGYCPGPAIASIFLLDIRLWLFVSAMLLGSVLYDTWKKSRSPEIDA
ncbi:MAG: YeeE/YedE family protein [Gammaproteobacteria bacterium]|nr:YeeE/YedE family protein [Gammaproteobacteria bacterium]